MLTTPVISDRQAKEFEANGFLVVRGAFNDDDMGHIDKWTREILEQPEVSGRHWVFHEESLSEPGKDLVSRIEYVVPFHDGFRQLSQTLQASVGQLFDEEAVLFKEKINFKMPGGDGFKPHQDSQAGWNEYADKFISVMVTIDEATVKNGCIRIAGGHHQRGLFKSWEPLKDEDMKGMTFKPYPTRPGDIVFFDNYAPHASEPNRSETMRRVYYATYNRLSDGDHMAQYYADKHKNYPPDIDRESGKEYVFRV